MPATKLTEEACKKAKAQPGERFELVDASCPGLRLRVSGDDVRVWYFIGRPKNGKPVRVKLGRYPDVKLKEAQSRANRQRDAFAEGKTSDVQLDKLTFADLAESFLANWPFSRESTRKLYENYLARPKERFGNRRAAQVSRADLVELLEEIAKEAPTSANRTQQVLRTMFGYGVNKGLFTDNPLAGVKKTGGKEQSKDRVLSDKELVALWSALDDDSTPAARTLRLALKTILLTCARPGEVAGMPRNEIDLDGPEPPLWTLPDARTKNKRTHLVPLSSLACETIKQAIAEVDKIGSGKHVFCSRYETTEPIARHSLSQATRRICEKLKMQPFTPHDLRRTAATLARAEGAPRDSVKALLNHIFDDVTGVYDRYNMLAEKRQAVELIEQRIRRLVGL